MNILFNSGFRSYSYNNSFYNNKGSSNTILTSKIKPQFYLAKDCVNFTSKSTSQNTKAEKQAIKDLETDLKNIENLHDPYSDVILITNNKLNSFNKKMDKDSSIDKTIKYLEGFKPNMFPNGEAKVFNMLKNENNLWKMDPDLYNQTWDFADILNEKFPDSKVKLVNEQFNVLDDILHFSKHSVNNHDYKIIRRTVNNIKGDILDNNFRINIARSKFYDIAPELDNKNTIKSIIKLTKDFPNGSNSIDAFIVKNADKTHREIANALLEPSVVSYEHIKPKSKRGDSSAFNYIIASKRMNNLRQSLSYEDFKDYAPNLPKTIQRYVDDIIKNSNDGKTKAGFFLPRVKDSIYNESNGEIDIDLSQLNPEFIKEYKSYIGKFVNLCDKHGWGITVG